MRSLNALRSIAGRLESPKCACRPRPRRIESTPSPGVHRCLHCRGVLTPAPRLQRVLPMVTS